MKLTLYKKFEHPFSTIEIDYHRSRDITLRYTVSDLNDWKKVDLYFILGLDHLRDLEIDPVVLHKQHRKQCMLYHPDKRKIDRMYFLTVQKAYEVLKTPIMKMKYDSIFFDESIPEDREYEENEFFVVFGNVFRRNAKFSNLKPVPTLGEINLEKEYVENFYKFWKAFDSWRRFEYTDDVDYENMNSHERRYNEKKSKNNRDNLKRLDILRLRELVDISIRRDPRVRKLKAKDVNKSMEDLSLSVNKKLITNNWTSEDILLLDALMRKNKKGVKYLWENITPVFNKKTKTQRNLREFLIKSKEIEKLGLNNK